MSKSSLRVTAGATLAVLIIIFVITLSRTLFNNKAKSQLAETAKSKLLSFQLDFNPEILLALKMIDCSIIKEYMENPRDQSELSMAYEEFASYAKAFTSKSVFWISDKDKKYYLDGKYLYTLDPTLAENSWFPGLLQYNGDYTLLVSYDSALKKTQLWIDAIVRDKTGKATGVTGTGIPLGDFVDKMYTNLPRNIKMYLYNDNMEVTGDKDPTIIEKKLQLSTMLPLDGVNTKAQEFTTFATKSGVFAVTPVPIYTLDWRVIFFIPYTPGAFLLNSILPILISFALIMLVIFLIVASKFLLPINALDAAMTQITQGNANLTARVNFDTSVATKQFLSLVENFNSFLSRLQSMVRLIANSSDNLKNTGKKLLECVNTATATLSQMDKTAANMLNQNKELDKAVDEMTASSSEISNSIRDMSDSATSVVKSVESSAASIQSITEGTERVANLFEESQGLLNDMSKQTDNGKERLTAVNHTIESLAQKSGAILDISKVIVDLATQTNLLAMNAAIEASHAGKAGQGFAVVASEIRKLAENSDRQGKLAATVIEESLEIINSMTQAGEELTKSFNKIYELSSDVKDHITQVSDGLSSQRSEGAEALQAMKMIQKASVASKENSDLCIKKGNTMAKTLMGFDSVVDTLKGEMDALGENVKQVTDSLALVSSVTEENKASIDTLAHEVSKFIV